MSLGKGNAKNRAWHGEAATVRQRHTGFSKFDKHLLNTVNR